MLLLDGWQLEGELYSRRPTSKTAIVLRGSSITADAQPYN
jgi:hypothetical protein